MKSLFAIVLFSFVSINGFAGGRSAYECQIRPGIAPSRTVYLYVNILKEKAVQLRYVTGALTSAERQIDILASESSRSGRDMVQYRDLVTIDAGTRQPVHAPEMVVGNLLVIPSNFLSPSQVGNTSGTILWVGDNFRASFSCSQLND